MKRWGAKIVSMALAVTIVCGMSNTASAAEYERTELSSMEFSDAIQGNAVSGELLARQKQFENMTIDELNHYIDSTIADINTRNRAASTDGASRSGAKAVGVPTVVELKALWLAAAQAAKLAGYPCSAKLVECSVLGINYNETKGAGGLFRDKIVTTNTYKNYIKGVKNGTYKTGKGYVLEHRKDENADLYYAIHNCTYTTTKSGKKYKVAVYDLYDFALMNYDSAFTGVVNNWAWLCQHTSVLHKINVNISFQA